jgi:preprotein translocase subunit SecA
VVAFHCVGENADNWNIKEIFETIKTIFPVQIEVLEKIKSYGTREEIIKYLSELADVAFEEMGVKIEKSLAESGLVNPFFQIIKGMMLRAVDDLWVEHLDAMDHLRTGIGLRGYGQRDPLIEYKKEAYNFFNRLLDGLRQQLVYSIYKIGAAVRLAPAAMSPLIGRGGPSAMERQDVRMTAPSKTMSESGSAIEKMAQQDAAKRQTTSDQVKPKLKDASGHKVGRNDPCPCGSRKKYKKCCGK